MKRNCWIVFIALLSGNGGHLLYAQMDRLHGEFKEFRLGQHSGNQIRADIWNDGEVGGKEARPELVALEWPINSGHTYLGQTMIKVGSEVFDANGDLKHIFSESMGWRPNDTTDPGTGDEGPGGEWYTFLPLPGFAKPNQDRLAMSQWRDSWPDFWPDKTEDTVEPGWPGSWNGYFGKNVMNADQESYFVFDDYNNREFAFYPDQNDSERRGLGMRVTARGLQWSNALVEDVLFFLYDVKNIGTTSYKKMLFAQFVGAAIGNTATVGGDNGDDDAAFDIRESLVYNFDPDNLGAGGYTPVGYYGCAFLESPGNPYDGIDNDYDAIGGSGKVIGEDLFASRTLNAGDEIIIVDYSTYKRTKTTMPNDTLRIVAKDRTLKFWPGKVIEEIPHNIEDDNLNGLIDESNGSTFEADGQTVTTYLYVGAMYIDYFDNTGTDNPLIDEYRDDGIDNDKDWDALNDDVGMDGVAGTGDFGENDGKPTSGWQEPGAVPGVTGAPNPFGFVDTGLPGEPHIDKTDIHESDMIGLTSFYLYTPWSLLPASNDELIWEKTKPGYLNDKAKPSDTDFTFGSGYFPMNAGQIERFSVAQIMGENFADLIINKQWASKAYQANYNFSKAPNIPTVTAIAGDNQVTLVWDDFAEKSVDPIMGRDFEGYKIYRSTDPQFRDMISVTDGYGRLTYRAPLAQFDLNDGYSGFAPIPINGIQFWLGTNTGLVHTLTDTTARNGQKYYYAVTSYDFGDPSKVSPTECAKYIAISASGVIDKGTNVVIARPEAPSAGYVASELEDLRMTAGSTATGRITYKVINPQDILDGHKYRVTFEDSLVTTTPVTRVTKSFTLADVTDGEAPDTLIDRSRFFLSTDTQPVTDGFQLTLFNEATLTLDAARSGWSRPGLLGFLFTGYAFGQYKGVPEAADYRIEFGGAGLDSSTTFLRGTKEVPGVPVNFRVYKLVPSDTGEVSVKSKFGFYKQDDKVARPNEFSAFRGKTMVSDQIIMLSDSGVPGFMFQLDRATFDSVRTLPDSGDFVTIRLLKPYLSHDAVEFVTRKEHIDEDLAKQDLNRIKVVPNPYVVSNSFEPQNPYANGRGPRELHFTHLPMKCTIRVYNIQGQLVATLEHDSPSVSDGTEIWNMLTKDQLDIAYGVYVYHVDAGTLGTKVGKFAVIK
jgi:hypothetical protein